MTQPDITDRLTAIGNLPIRNTIQFGDMDVWFDARDEIERLRTQCGGNCRYWEARWRDEAKLTAEAAAFLDEAANRLETEASPVGNQVAADNCRHMANKLRA